MIRYFVDTEFLETGFSIDLISIGIVSSDGREFYAVNADIERQEPLYSSICRHRWLMENVVPHLPLHRLEPFKQYEFGEQAHFELDHRYEAVKPRKQIADEVRQFLQQPNEPMELWTYYGAYDHVVVSWLWGPMVNRPKGIPMFSHDLMQWASMLGLDDSTLPKQEGALHNALEDARWTKQAWEYLDGYARRCDSTKEATHE